MKASQSALASSSGFSAARSSVCFWCSGTTCPKNAAASSGSSKLSGRLDVFGRVLAGLADHVGL
jgi:hypothetical protein